VEEILGDETLQKTVFSDIPTSPSMKAELSIQDPSASPQLNIDIDGNGTTDTTLTGDEQQNSEASFDILNNIIDQMDIQKGLKHDLKEKIKEAKKEYKKGKNEKAVKKLDNIIKKLEKEIKKNSGLGNEDDKDDKKEKKEHNKNDDDRDDHKNKDGDHEEHKKKISTEDAQRIMIIIEQIKIRVL